VAFANVECFYGGSQESFERGVFGSKYSFALKNHKFKTCAFCYVSNIVKVGSGVVISSVAKLSQEKLGLQSQSKFFLLIGFLDHEMKALIFEQFGFF
jgi:hypothetical protein